MEAPIDFPEDVERYNDEKLQPSNNSDDYLQSAQEQLAELQLLARADLHSAASPLVREEEEGIQMNEDEPHGVATGGLSSFTAIMATSRKIATKSADHSAVLSDGLESENGVPIVPLDQACGPLAVDILHVERLRSPKASRKSLPTLDEVAEDEEEDVNDEETPETSSYTISTSFVEKLSSSRAEVAPVKQELELEASATDDFEFAEMLEQLSRGKLGVFALTLDDLTAHKLKRLHTALNKAHSLTPTMPVVRALVSVDMLQLLLRRLGARTVCDAVSRAIQHANGGEESTLGLDPIALLTSSNIAAVVLEARRQLTTPSPQTPRCASPGTSSTRHVRRCSQTSPKSCRSPSSSVSSSPRCGTPAAERRSVLAKEGVHVLMQEKLVAFEYRSQANALPAFRLRGDSATLTDSAAKRRQRGLQYASEHISHRSVHM